MTNMIEGKLTTNSEQMTKFLLNMGMAWLGTIHFDETDTQLPMKNDSGSILRQLKQGKMNQGWPTS